VVAALAGVLAALPAVAHARGSPATAALQIALRARGVYDGPIDGVRGTGTLAALRAFQQRAGIAVTGRPDRRTRAALGRLGRPRVGARRPAVGMVGWDVSWLEYRLASRGFSPGRIDGRFDRHTDAALLRFTRFARLGHHCEVGRRVFGALRRTSVVRPRISLVWPLDERTVVRRYGIRGGRLHTGIEIASRFGAGVAAAGTGTVVFADWRPGPQGLVVVLRHRRGAVTVYGHLSRIDVRPGQRVPRGAFLGLVGRTGRARSTALYFEVRVRGAAVDPLRVLG
jgi:murein DD-endopeptidase MepM/ murein hydrolase activator NlpD